VWPGHAAMQAVEHALLLQGGLALLHLPEGEARPAGFTDSA